MLIRLGLIGISPGNGHPYDPYQMEKSGFPVILNYPAQPSFPNAAIKGARVTHVWAQNRTTGRHIAESMQPDNVVNGFTDMILQTPVNNVRYYSANAATVTLAPIKGRLC